MLAARPVLVAGLPAAAFASDAEIQSGFREGGNRTR